MAKVTIKGHEFNALEIKDSFNRRAAQFRNNIAASLKKLGLTEDDFDIPLEPAAVKKAPASAVWYLEGYRLYYSYSLGRKFVDNLYVVSRVVELQVDALLTEQITAEEFIHEFSEDKDVEEKRKKAREVLGLSHDTSDMELINKKFKDLAKEYHPDMPTGNLERFKAINHAHKTLKRELE